MMLQLLVSFIVGVLFSAGLLVSQMVDPNKVINFLDVSGNWDPSLMLVMGSALVVFGSGYRLLIKDKNKPLLSKSFSLPGQHFVDGRLVTGASIFGIGWGVVGLCPGPAIANLSGSDGNVIAFVLSMVVGMILSRFLGHHLNKKRSNSERS